MHGVYVCLLCGVSVGCVCEIAMYMLCVRLAWLVWLLLCEWYSRHHVLISSLCVQHTKLLQQTGDSITWKTLYLRSRL